MGFFVTFFALILSVGAENVSQKRPFDAFLSLGATVSPKSESKISFGGSTSTSSASDKLSPAIGLEALIRVNDRLSAAFLAEFTDYAFSDGTPRDRILFFGVGPEYSIPTVVPGLEFFGSVAAGLAQNRLGAKSEAGATTILTVSDETANAFMVSPRIGVDFDLNSLFTIRALVGYESAKFKYSGNVRAISGGADLGTASVELTRSWVLASIGLCGRF